MKLQFKTSRNQYGRRRWLEIDTEKRTFATDCPRMVPDGIEIKAGDYKSLVEKLEKEGFSRI